jgi:hypothetical protein
MAKIRFIMMTRRVRIAMRRACVGMNFGRSFCIRSSRVRFRFFRLCPGFGVLSPDNRLCESQAADAGNQNEARTIKHGTDSPQK